MCIRDRGYCEYPEENYDCDGNCLIDVDCNGECGGTAVNDCSGICGGDTEIDLCGCCGGTGIIDQACACQDILHGTDIYENYTIVEGARIYECTDTEEYPYPVEDCFGECGGEACENTCGTCTNPCDASGDDGYNCGCSEMTLGCCDCDCETILVAYCDNAADGSLGNNLGSCEGVGVDCPQYFCVDAASGDPDAATQEYIDNLPGAWIPDCAGGCADESVGIDCAGNCDGSATIDQCGYCCGPGTGPANIECTDLGNSTCEALGGIFYCDDGGGGEPPYFCAQRCSVEDKGVYLGMLDQCGCCIPVSYTHLTLPTKRIV